MASETTPKLCSTSGCVSARRPGRTKCLRHERAANRGYAAKRAAAKPARILNSDRVCRHPGCERAVFASDACKNHHRTYVPRPLCSAPDCTKSRCYRGFCLRHLYAAVLAEELVIGCALPPQSPQERFASRVNVTKTCHLWQGSTDSQGRGHFTVSTESAPAPRVAYQFEHGSIPTDDEGKPLPLDHGCRRPLCVRVDHLEPVTALENARRQGVASGRDHITQADGWLFGLAIPAWQRGADNMPDCVVSTG